MINKPELEPFTLRDQKDLRGHLSRPFKEKEKQWVMGSDQRSSSPMFSPKLSNTQNKPSEEFLLL